MNTLFNLIRREHKHERSLISSSWIQLDGIAKTSDGRQYDTKNFRYIRFNYVLNIFEGSNTQALKDWHALSPVIDNNQNMT